MAEKLEAGMPNDLIVGGSWQVIFAAVDATTGADIGGVVVSKAVVVAEGSNLPSAETISPILLGVGV